jgi:hypothetical protein
MPTKADTVGLALRHLGILSVDEAVTADQIDYCGTILDAILAEKQSVWGVTFTWTSETVPAAAYISLAHWLAAEIAPHYEVVSPKPLKVAEARFRAYALPDDREDDRDLDDDGTVTDAEIATGEEAEYF